MKRLVTSVAAAAAIVCGIVCGVPDAAKAQTWPAKPIRNVMSYAGSTETVIRLINQKVGDALGQPVILETQPGANGSVGVSTVARAAPDGYTVLCANASLVIRRFLVKDVPWDPFKDLTPIRHIFDSVGVIVAHPQGPTSLKEMIETARQDPGKLSFGTNGIGSAYHMAAEQVQLLTGVQFLHVPYKASPQAMTDLIAGRIQTAFSGHTNTQSFVDAGKAKFLATLNNSRFSLMPNVPTVKELLPGYQSPPLWGAYFGPAALPAPIVQRLQVEIARAIATPEVRGLMESVGLMPASGGPEELAAMMQQDVGQLAKLVKMAGIQPE